MQHLPGIFSHFLNHIKVQFFALFLNTTINRLTFWIGNIKLLKSSQNKKDLNDLTTAPFSVFFCCWQLRKRFQKQVSCDVIKVLLISWWLWFHKSFSFKNSLIWKILKRAKIAFNCKCLEVNQNDLVISYLVSVYGSW